MPVWLQVTVPILAAAIASYGTARVRARSELTRMSGRIETSTAAELWAESRSIRKMLVADVTSLRGEVAALQRERDQCLERVETLRMQMRRCFETLRRLHPGENIEVPDVDPD